MYFQETNKEVEKREPMEVQTESSKTQKSTDVIMEDVPEEEEPVENRASTSEPKEKKANREKFDSGIGDEIVENHDNLSPMSSDCESPLEHHIQWDVSSDDEMCNRRKDALDSVLCGIKWGVGSDSSSLSDAAEEAKAVPVQSEIRTISSPYTIHMRNKIQELPLPSILKNYLNFYRES